MAAPRAGRALESQAQIEALEAGAAAAPLCELNVVEQVLNVSQTTVARDAWARGQPLAVHGLVYDSPGRPAARPRREHL